MQARPGIGRPLFLAAAVLSANPRGDACAQSPEAVSIERAAPERRKVRVRFTRYFTERVELAPEPGSGVRYTFKNLRGRKETRYLTSAAHEKFRLEGMGWYVCPDGARRVVHWVEDGRGREIQPDLDGWGAKGNPIVPFVHIAADPKYYPYGTRVFVGEAAGHRTTDGRILDGHFWVGDAGDRIKGPSRFDLFVGDREVEDLWLSKEPTDQREFECTVDIIRKPPAGLDPRKGDQRAEILRRKGFLGRKNSQAARKQALIKFQAAHEQIPSVERGYWNGAVTLWFLTEAACQAAEAPAPKDE